MSTAQHNDLAGQRALVTGATGACGRERTAQRPGHHDRHDARHRLGCYDRAHAHDRLAREGVRA